MEAGSIQKILVLPLYQFHCKLKTIYVCMYVYIYIYICNIYICNKVNEIQVCSFNLIEQYKSLFILYKLTVEVSAF